MQSKMNLKIKFRESFRPFAPAVLKEDASGYFELEGESPYMLMVAPVRSELLTEQGDGGSVEDDMIRIINTPRSVIPAVTHVDHSARIQTVEESTNPLFTEILRSFKRQTGSSVLVNTSFNVRGEPIVCSPMDAYKCFMRTNMDVLVLEKHILIKTEQPNYTEHENWQEEFQLD
jgi:carbamoyltransferase